MQKIFFFHQFLDCKLSEIYRSSMKAELVLPLFWEGHLMQSRMALFSDHTEPSCLSRAWWTHSPGYSCPLLFSTEELLSPAQRTLSRLCSSIPWCAGCSSIPWGSGAALAALPLPNPFWRSSNAPSRDWTLNHTGSHYHHPGRDL